MAVAQPARGDWPNPTGRLPGADGGSGPASRRARRRARTNIREPVWLLCEGRASGSPLPFPFHYDGQHRWRRDAGATELPLPSFLPLSLSPFLFFSYLPGLNGKGGGWHSDGVRRDLLPSPFYHGEGRGQRAAPSQKSRTEGRLSLPRDPRLTPMRSTGFTQWDPNKSSSKDEVACPKCGRNCKSLDASDLIIRCSFCNLFAVRGRQDSKIYLVFDEHGLGILEL